jgi:riboflavin kinase/FMN adenylyltransferase
MRLLRSLDDLPEDLRHGAVTIGNFDGVHRGHARLVERLLAQAADLGGPAVVFTFDPHPVRLLRPEAAPPPLTWTDRKAELLSELGVTATIAYPTDESLLALSPDEFFDQIIRQKLAARGMVEGPNFFFGHGRGGNIETLWQLCTGAGVALEIVPPVDVAGQIVSSSRVRQAIAAGDVDLARELLTRPYRVRGMVTHGAGRGGKIGFPTANLAAIDTLLPAVGVYAGRAHTTAGSWPAAVNIGPNPTFGESALKVEVHLIDFAGSLYGQPLELDFVSRLRGVQTFASVEALKAQLASDVSATREMGKESGKE